MAFVGTYSYFNPRKSVNGCSGSLKSKKIDPAV